MHGLGNDFIIIDTSMQNIDINPQTIQFISNRKYGIGCDQVLIIKSRNIKNEYDYIIYNQDGSKVPQCGNGARAIIKYLYLINMIITQQTVILHTSKTTIRGFVDSVTNLISVNMGVASFTPEKLPFKQPISNNNTYEVDIHGKQINFGIASIGNPHVIIKIEHENELSRLEELQRIAIFLQQSPMFPESVNVNFYYPIDNKHIKLLTYERGVGFTNACGSGAAATVAFLVQNNVTHYATNDATNVIMLGGDLTISIINNEVRMLGDATYVFNGVISL